MSRDWVKGMVCVFRVLYGILKVREEFNIAFLSGFMHTRNDVCFQLTRLE